MKQRIIGSTVMVPMGRRDIILTGVGKYETLASVWVPDGSESRVETYLDQAHPGWRYPTRTNASKAHESAFLLAEQDTSGLQQLTKLRKRAERSLKRLSSFDTVKKR